MYEEFWGCTRTPFGRDLPVKQLFQSQGYRELASRLLYAAQRKQFALITGEVGAGKSTTVRAVVTELNPARFQSLYLSDSQLTPRNFYWEALHQLGHAPRFYRGDAKRQLQQALIELHDAQRKIPVIIIDEGHLLDKEMLEEIRFLMNYEIDSTAPMSLIVVGQPELRRILRLQLYEAIAQRINVRFHLPGLEAAETAQYITHHLAVAGVNNTIFTEEAVRLIHECSAGIARKVNNLCSACLLDAFAQRKLLVDDHMVKIVWENEFAM
jgi:type II secretory pathway predicted ATPase ExeA